LLAETDGKLGTREKPERTKDIEPASMSTPDILNIPTTHMLNNQAGTLAININIDIACSTENIDGLAEKIKQFIKDMSEQ
jgi:hypothetical protein